LTDEVVAARVPHPVDVQLVVYALVVAGGGDLLRPHAVTEQEDETDKSEFLLEMWRPIDGRSIDRAASYVCGRANRWRGQHEGTVATPSRPPRHREA
jgi:hypothetical protein